MKFRNQFMKYQIHANEAVLDDTGGDTNGDDVSGDDLSGGEGSTTDSSVEGVSDSSTDTTTDSSVDAKGAWPDDWQQRFSKGDEKLQKVASRYASPEAAFEALVAAQQRIRSGELKPALPENATDDELAAWREDHGIPAKPEDYDLTFDSGLVIGEEDKPIVDEFLSIAHEHNMTPEQVKSVIEWNETQKEAQAEERIAMEEQQRVEALDKLNVEYGGNFRRNINMIEGVLSMLPEGVREEFQSARLPDGTALFNNTDVIRGFVQLANELNPAGIVAPAGGGDPMKGLSEEIANIENTMKTNRTAYNKDEAMQARYRELLVAREKMQSR